jgi:hypothetical protein
MLHILKCKYLNRYKLELIFDNDTKWVADLQDLPKAGTVFEPLKDTKIFRNIKLEHGGVTTWLDGQLDIAPEYLFFLANKTNPKYSNIFREWGYIDE